ncbi:hypothetical protein PMSD_00890 [Paenibacillus macquariensis subsp. defensor]|nr:hypothetical protein PMSD_00890 [Paenibacillus macquariensis subsp. defensor]
MGFEKYHFELGERVTFFWKFAGDDRMTPKWATTKEIEDMGVWFEFIGEEDESFVTYPEMHLFIRESSNDSRRNRGAFVNEITKAHFGDNLDPDVCRHN